MSVMSLTKRGRLVSNCPRSHTGGLVFTKSIARAAAHAGNGPTAWARNIDDLRNRAMRRLPKGTVDYLDGGAGDEVTPEN